MPALVKITSSMFPDLYGSLLRELDATISEKRWKTAFVSRWPCDEDYFGYALTDRGSLVGMQGMIFSRRSFGGQITRFCNLHAWYVKPKHRARSLVLMKPVMDLKDHTITDFTSNPRLNKLIKRLGFSSLDRRAVMLPPLPRNGSKNGAAQCELIDLTDDHSSHLDPVDLQIYRDHQGIDCGHLLVRSPGGYCYVVYSRIERHWIPYCFIHYLSDRRLFAEHHAVIRSRLMRNTRGQCVVVAARLLADVKVPLSLRIRAVEKLYRPTRVAPHEVDSLYSEVVLFKHSTIPGLRQRLSATANRYLPAAVNRRIGLPS